MRFHPKSARRTLHYFAYGSNMLSSRLALRAPSAEPLGTGVLERHSLRFHKTGRDGSGKCDIHFTGRARDRVHGVLFRLEAEHAPALDAAEDLGRGYGRKEVSVAGESGCINAFTYFALQTDVALQPFHWYKALVLAGAREHGLPRGYIDMIKSVISCPDPDRQRHQAHESILSAAHERDGFLHYHQL